MTCTHTIMARPGTPAHVCGKPAVWLVRDPYTFKSLYLCEECAKEYKRLGELLLAVGGGDGDPRP